METILALPNSPFQWLILFTLLISLGVEISYYLFYTKCFHKEKNTESLINTEAISVIICCKNEAAYLEENLPLFLLQDYQNYEVIVVNDGSTDNTEAIISKHQLKFPQLRTTTIPADQKFNHNKKLAITIGIKAAKNECLIFTSVKNKPSGNTWLQTISNHWHKGVVMGYANFENEEGLLHNFLKFDLLQKNLKASCFALSGNPYSGNGNNLGYHKSDFFKNKGFAKNAHFEAGYDHIMVQQLGQLSGNSVCNHPNAKINLSPDNKSSQWRKINQQYYKCRKFFPFKVKFFLDLEIANVILFYLTLIFAMFFTDLYLLLSLSLLLKILFTTSFFKIYTSHLKEEKIFLSSCIYDILVLFSKLYFSCTNFIFSKR